MADDYFSDRTSGPRPRVSEETDNRLWAAILALLRGGIDGANGFLLESKLLARHEPNFRRLKDWVCDQLTVDPRIQSQRLREMAQEIGYAGGKSIFDDYVREVGPRFVAARTFQRTIYRPGELVHCDLWEPAEHVAVGHGQRRRGWVVT